MEGLQRNGSLQYDSQYANVKSLNNHRTGLSHFPFGYSEFDSPDTNFCAEI